MRGWGRGGGREDPTGRRGAEKTPQGGGAQRRPHLLQMLQKPATDRERGGESERSVCGGGATSS